MNVVVGARFALGKQSREGAGIEQALVEGSYEPRPAERKSVAEVSIRVLRGVQGEDEQTQSIAGSWGGRRGWGRGWCAWQALPKLGRARGRAPSGAHARLQGLGTESSDL